MQRFNDDKGTRRLLDIKNMQANEVLTYYLQVKGMHKKQDKKQLEQAVNWMKHEIEDVSAWQDVNKWILTIKSKDHRKLIGVIKVFEMKPEEAFVKIHIPNENWVFKYGTEALDQFVKICKEMQCFSTIEFETDNEIVERYRVQRKMETYKIEIKKETE